MNRGQVGLGIALSVMLAAETLYAQTRPAATSGPATAVASEPATAASQPTAGRELPPPDTSPAHIAKLIGDLGNDDVKIRLAAHAELARIGPAASAALVKATESPDPEVKTRAQELLSNIALGEAAARSQAIAAMLKWSQPPGSGAYVFPLPAGKVLLTSNDDGVHALDPATGKDAWVVEAKADWRLAVSGTIVAIAQDDKIQGVDIATGKLRWQYEPPGGNRPVVMAADESAVYVDTIAGQLLAVDASSGKLIWKVPALAAVRPLIVTPKAVVLAGNTNDAINRNRPTQIFDQVVLALDRTSGKELWRYDADSPFACMSAGKDAVYLFRERDLLAVSLKSGDLLWKYKLPETRDPGYFRAAIISPQISPDTGQCRPIVSGDKVYLLFGNSIVCLTSGGEEVFRHKLSQIFGGEEFMWWNRGTIYNSDYTVRAGAAGYLIVDGDTAYFQRGQRLAGIDLKQGRLLWALNLGGTFTGTPLLSGGTLYFGIESPRQEVLDAEKDTAPPSPNLKPGIHALGVQGK